MSDILANLVGGVRNSMLIRVLLIGFLVLPVRGVLYTLSGLAAVVIGGVSRPSSGRCSWSPT